MTEELPARTTEKARAYFMALYSSRWGPHPSTTNRGDQDVAAEERAMWRSLIDSVSQDEYERLIEEVRGAMDDADRKGKPVLWDFQKAVKKLRARKFAYMEASPQYQAPEDRLLSRREYLQANEHRHQGSPTFARLWWLEFKQQWAGYTPPAPPQGRVEGRVDGRDVDAALEADERTAMQEEEPW